MFYVLKVFFGCAEIRTLCFIWTLEENCKFLKQDKFLLKFCWNLRSLIDRNLVVLGAQEFVGDRGIINEVILRKWSFIVEENPKRLVGHPKANPIFGAVVHPSFHKDRNRIFTCLWRLWQFSDSFFLNFIFLLHCFELDVILVVWGVFFA